MGLYHRYLLPRFMDWACGVQAVEIQRRRLVPRARGRVLEVGIGPGRNLAFYDAAKVEQVWGLDPSRGMQRLAAKRARASGLEFEALELSAEAIPLDEGSCDTIVFTYVLCTIPDPLRALGEMRRVLKPEGRILFCEHGRAPDEKLVRWQGRLTPLWRLFTGGCHLDRDPIALLESAGFRVDQRAAEWQPGFRPLSFQVRGQAVHAARGADR